MQSFILSFTHNCLNSLPMPTDSRNHKVLFLFHPYAKVFVKIFIYLFKCRPLTSKVLFEDSICCSVVFPGTGTSRALKLLFLVVFLKEVHEPDRSSHCSFSKLVMIVQIR